MRSVSGLVDRATLAIDGTSYPARAKNALRPGGWAGTCASGAGVRLPRGAPHACGPRLLARAVVAVDRAGLDGFVDRLHERTVLGLRGGVVARGTARLEPAEVSLDTRGVAAVLEPLTRGTLDPLLL